MVYGSDLNTAVIGEGSTERPSAPSPGDAQGPGHPSPTSLWQPPPWSLLSAVRLPPSSPAFGGDASLVVAILMSM